MVTITPMSTVPAVEGTENLLVQLTEGLCQAYSTSATIQPSHVVNFSIGAATIEPVTDGDTTTYSAIVPVTVTGQITYVPKGCCPCKSVTRLFAESFTVGFTGLTAAPTTFNVTTGMSTSGPANVKSCNRAYGYNINTAITITAA